MYLTDVPPRQQQSSTARRALFQDTVEHQVELPFAQGKTVEEENSAKGAGEAATVEMEPSPTSQPVLQPEQKTEATRDETDSATPSLARRSASRQSTSFSIFIRKVHSGHRRAVEFCSHHQWKQVVHALYRLLRVARHAGVLFGERSFARTGREIRLGARTGLALLVVDGSLHPLFHCSTAARSAPRPAPSLRDSCNRSSTPVLQIL